MTTDTTPIKVFYSYSHRGRNQRETLGDHLSLLRRIRGEISMRDHGTETLRRKGKADEDCYFAEQDRKRIEKPQRPAPACAGNRHSTTRVSYTGWNIGGVAY